VGCLGVSTVRPVGAAAQDKIFLSFLEVSFFFFLVVFIFFYMYLQEESDLN
jgi:hypothetical protein